MILEVKRYFKYELAYFYEMNRNTFRARLFQCEDCLNELVKFGYREDQRFLTAHQVEIIIKHFGEPRRTIYDKKRPNDK